MSLKVIKKNSDALHDLGQNYPNDVDLVQKILEISYPKTLLPKSLTVKSASLQNKEKITATYEFIVDAEIAGLQSRSLFGGMIPSLSDSLTSGVAVGYRIRSTKLGEIVPMQVTVEITTSLILGAVIGDKVTVECNVIMAGSKMVFTEAKFFTKNGKIMALGRHNLAVVTPPPPPTSSTSSPISKGKL
jgi:acyl-coenzyme A thioesterase PaaI-like protein